MVMDPERAERRLAAIFAADVAGYSRLTHEDEAATLRTLAAHRAIMDALIGEYCGRIANTAGDSVLAEFGSAVDAVQCAVAIQERLREANRLMPEERRLQFRIGIHVGDAVLRGDDLLGDGVNLAARLQGIAEPGGICLSGLAHDYVRKVLPLTFTDLGPRQVKNIDEPVHAWAVSASRSGAEKPLPLPDRPSIAVLPFANLSRDQDQEYFADGVTGDIIGALSRLRWLFVIARNSTFAYKGKAVDVRQVSRDLGIRYVLEGSVRTAAGRIRIAGQLSDAETGTQIWAEKYDRDLQDIFAVQDEITEHVIAAIEPHLYAAEGFRAETKAPGSLDAWGLVVRAMSLINRVGRTQNEEAQALLREAIRLEPSYSRAHALLSWAVWWAALCYWWPDTEAGYAQAALHATDALRFDPNEPWARMTFGLCLSQGGHHDRALGELQTALKLNPSFALGHTALGWALLRSGRFDEAIDETGKALRMSPIDSFAGIYTTIHGLALLAARRFEEALPFLRSSVAAFVGYAGHYNTLISCCGHLGLMDEAQEFIALRNRVAPPIRLSVLRRNLGRFAHCEVFVDGLRKAGVPE
ncbi:adenylate/guanylate cyclase domain-containing protein [Microvirga subterranea]|uniref:Adenylate cyclase n=1 Tax=Microvirga subterranea TaxID=186651 RepID=A0A370HMU3_9HYPH|nr:adenylate/guanylate cyclase domain-containing protein [Microvirga subterranea]RDI59896.1 adenylate cyclase [Microvirga subterranea]